MNTLKKLAFIAACLLVTNTSFSASKLIINGNCQLDLQGEVEIHPGTGNIIVTTAQDVSTCTPPVSDGPQILSFSVTPSTIEAGDSVSIAWSTEHASSCRGSGNLPGWQNSNRGPNGNISLTVNNAGSYTAGLVCWNADGQSELLPLTVEPTGGGGGGPGCEDAPPATGLSLAPNAIWGDSSADGRFWNGVFIGNFPGTTNSRQYYQQPGRYHAIQFNTGNMPSTASGQVGGSEPQGPWALHAGPGRKLVSISACPGDFRPDSNRPGCLRAASTTGLWIRWGAFAEAGRCQLEPNTTYYLNVVHTADPAGTVNPTWHCDSDKANCGLLINSQSSGW